ncbi:MAG TPA: hypothetical protein VN577_20210 [Terriglobales bacterium]|nr:hypothetical protein [Terriglobales bacterium]
MTAQRAYERRSIDGFEFGVRTIYQGRSIHRLELVKFSDAPWPPDETLMKYFGGNNFGARIKRAGPVLLLEVYVD